MQVWTDDGDVEIIANDQGNRVTPSYVAFTDTERLIGDAAKNQAALNPKNTIFDAKYTSFSDLGMLSVDVLSDEDLMILKLSRIENNGRSPSLIMVKVHR